jgi:hypothetical protein
LMVVGYVPFFFANTLFMHGPFLLLECAWLVALLVFAIKRGRENDAPTLPSPASGGGNPRLNQRP